MQKWQNISMPVDFDEEVKKIQEYRAKQKKDKEVYDAKVKALKEEKRRLQVVKERIEAAKPIVANTMFNEPEQGEVEVEDED